MVYPIFSSIGTDVLEEVCLLFERGEAGAYCPFGLLLERLDSPCGPAPRAADVAFVLAGPPAYWPSEADRWRAWDVLHHDAERFMDAWDTHKVTAGSLRDAMGLPVR